MQVTVVSGSGLKGDIIGAPDVYVVLKHAGQVHKTSVESSKDPVWRQSFQMLATTQIVGGCILGKGALEVEVWDKDRLSKDDLLGTGTIDLEQLEWNRTTVKVIDLKKGQVTLEIKAQEFGHGKRAPESSVPEQQPIAPPRNQEALSRNPPAAFFPPSPPPPPLKDPFPIYQGPYRPEIDDYESRYFIRRDFSAGDDLEARRMNEVSDTFPSYQGQRAPGRTPTSQFRPLPDLPGDHFGPPGRPAEYRGDSGEYRGQYRASRAYPSGSASVPNDQGRSWGPPPPPPPQVPAKKHPDIGTLHITVLKATGLKGTIDAAVRLKIEDKKIETTVKKDTQNPQWSESFKFFVRLNQGNQPGVRLGRTATMPLHVTLLDKKANEEVGSTMVSLQELYEGKGTEVQGAQLKDKSGNVVGDMTLTLKPLAFGLKFYKGKLRCRVIRATDLKAVQGGEPDAFVVARLRDEKQTTRVVNQSRNPEWEEDCMFTPDVYEKRGVVQCTADLTVDVYSRSAAGEEKLGSGVVQLGNLVQKRPQKRTVDLLDNGKLYLEVEADNFGMIPADEPYTSQSYVPSTTSAAGSRGTSPDPGYGHGQQGYGQGPYGAAYPAGYPATSPPAERPVLPGHPMPPSSTLPMVPLAGANSRWASSGMPPLDTDDATIASLKEDLHRLQRESMELEKRNSNDVVPLQMELNVVRAQLERAIHQIERLHSDGSDQRHRQTGGSYSSSKQPRNRSLSAEHSRPSNASASSHHSHKKPQSPSGRLHPEPRPFTIPSPGSPHRTGASTSFQPSYVRTPPSHDSYGAAYNPYGAAYRMPQHGGCCDGSQVSLPYDSATATYGYSGSQAPSGFSRAPQFIGSTPHPVGRRGRPSSLMATQAASWGA